MRPIDIVFEGGGCRGLAHNGAMASVLDAGLEPRRLVGTSAGAITASLVAAGHDGASLCALSQERAANGRSRMTEFIAHPGPFGAAQLENSRLGRMLQRAELPGLAGLERRLERALLQALLEVPGFANLFSEVELGGLFGDQGFLEWLGEKLDDARPGLRDATFQELHDATGVHLTVVATDTDDRTEVLLNHVTAPDCPVRMGVRMSMSIPFVWPEVVWDARWGRVAGRDLAGHRLVDGGVVSNFPLRALLSPEPWVREAMGVEASTDDDVLGLSLDLDTPVPGAPARRTLFGTHAAAESHASAGDRAERLLDTMLTGNDAAVAEHHRPLICKLPAGGFGVTEFDMATERLLALLNAGRDAAQRYLEQRLGAAPA